MIVVEIVTTSALPMPSHYSILRAAQLPNLAAPPTGRFATSRGSV